MKKKANRIINRNISIQPSMKKDIEKYLMEKDFKRTNMIEFALETYLTEESHPDYYEKGPNPFENKSESLPFRLTEELYERVYLHAINNDMTFTKVIYNALVEWLYVSGRVGS